MTYHSKMDLCEGCTHIHNAGRLYNPDHSLRLCPQCKAKLNNGTLFIPFPEAANIGTSSHTHIT